MTTNEEKAHTPEPWATSRDAVPSGHTQITVYAERTGERVATVFLTQANADLIAAAPDMLAALEATDDLALALMERAAKIDRKLAKANGAELECEMELGEIVRLRQQLGRNRAAMAKALGN